MTDRPVDAVRSPPPACKPEPPSLVLEDPRASREIAQLIALMEALRTPKTGCPWDVAQTFETIAPYTLEEAQEVADAIDRGDRTDLCEELGDLLLQVVFHAQMAREEGSFDFGDVVEGITAKLIRRHPHVFANPEEFRADEIPAIWQRIKAEEKAQRLDRAKANGLQAPDSALDGVLRTMPALKRAEKLQRRASKVGFDWSDPLLVLRKIEEEIGEIEEAMRIKGRAEVHEEIGDLLFAVANLARHMDGDPEEILQGASTKFERRFRRIEAALGAMGKTADSATLGEMEALWQAAKQEEHAATPR